MFYAVPVSKSHQGETARFLTGEPLSLLGEEGDKREGKGHPCASTISIVANIKP